MYKHVRQIIVCFIIIFFCSGCTSDDIPQTEKNNTTDVPELSKDIEFDSDGIPVIDVYVKETGKVEQMDIETYLQGVLAGEMRNDWPMEALKAQAILARTYTLKFIDTKDSKYEGADISTDITEAQAYNAESVNDRIRKAVEETRGIVMVYEGELPNAWFHAHSGGMTEIATIGIEYKNDPEYLVPVVSYESDNAPEDVKSWEASFTAKEVIDAVNACGVKIEHIEEITIGRKGESGRAAEILINGEKISAPSFRINIGSERLKSTLIEDITKEDDKIIFTGKGYGHGVGMSQWGAYGLAEKGATAQTIVSRYFTGVSFVDLWE